MSELTQRWELNFPPSGSIRFHRGHDGEFIAVIPEKRVFPLVITRSFQTADDFIRNLCERITTVGCREIGLGNFDHACRARRRKRKTSLPPFSPSAQAQVLPT